MCLPKGVADQGGCPHAKSWRKPDGCCQHRCHHGPVSLPTPRRRHTGRRSHGGESVASLHTQAVQDLVCLLGMHAPVCWVQNAQPFVRVIYKQVNFTVYLLSIRIIKQNNSKFKIEFNQFFTWLKLCCSLEICVSVCCLQCHVHSVPSRREGPYSSERLPHAHQCQLFLLPARVRRHI